MNEEDSKTFKRERCNHLFVAKFHSQAALTVKYVGVGQGMTVSLVSKLNVINALHIIPKLFLAKAHDLYSGRIVFFFRSLCMKSASYE